MRELTGIYDKKDKEIKEGDILFNDFVSDLWIVELKNKIYYAYLVPSSGYIRHSNKKYPACIQDLKVVGKVFEIIGNRYNNPELIK